ncbi:uncharacterized protein PHACADRAFT_248941 [Phanerochaete carnosa HHB-10118-sp]|uniref:Uncharacterized protein n=1 Tax=Phanerochaete carnosa (strain HHB-10118-sp) TaxID=650164 RepID=K5WID4_PHACS|nr:uncharacterized protein PHACADRAFT_248941 [Phanerochaete carnosa HHB-10118-sp]EKM58844.1 hypothetical protein PHACADRAFT_248941 [Phanerochaete carnosa HHB-10118-sp]
MAFSNLTTKRHAALQGKAGPFAGFRILGSRTRVQSGPKIHRQGLRYPRSTNEPPAELERNQSIFVRRYKIKRRFMVLKTIVAGAGYHQLSEDRSEGDARDGLMAEDNALDVDLEGDGLQWLEEKMPMLPSPTIRTSTA